MLNPLTIRFLTYSLRMLPWVSALSIGNMVTGAMQSGIDAFVSTHTEAASRSLVVKVLGHVLGFPTNIVLAPVKALVASITSLFNRNDTAIAANTIFIIKKSANGVYQYVTGPEFMNFAVSLTLKVAAWVLVVLMAYHIAQFITIAIRHYINLRIDADRNNSGSDHTDVRRSVR